MQLPDLNALLKTYDIQPDKSRGQHFLIDESVVADMLAAADIQSTDTVVEIGPGMGVLTSGLVQRAGRVMAYELDARLAQLIRGQHIDKLEVIEGDVMRAPLPRRGIDRYKVVANIPYSITGSLLRKLLASLPAPTSITLLVQREVAERVVARPGQMSRLSVAAQLKADCSIVRVVPPEAFWPAPAVDSAVLHLQLLPQLRVDVDETAFMRFVGHGFAQKRKQLKNTLSAGLHLQPVMIEPALEAIGVAPTARAQELSLQEWAKLYDQLPSR